jgi:pSer/pThr/pTyr-binding forkhead associated (FHA) protein
LRLVNGPKSGSVFSSSLPTAVIGRNDPPAISVDIDLTDAEIGDPPMISRRHARIERDIETGDFHLVDIGSTNGSWVEGVRLEPGCPSVVLTVPVRLRLANLEFDTIYVDQ